MGVLLWASSETPSNHSPFSFSEVEPIQAAKHQNHHLTLQFVLIQEGGVTVKEIKASIKQEVPAPMNFHKMLKQHLMFTMTNEIILDTFNANAFGPSQIW